MKPHTNKEDRVTMIAVLIGSANDRATVQESRMMEVFEAVGLTVPVHVISCHRNPSELDRFCRDSDVDVYVAAAGLAAALPGALSAATEMRRLVIGVPLDDYGIDSCLRLPAGVPVMTAGVGKSGLRNAALAACQVAAIGDHEIAVRLADYLDKSARPAQFDISLEPA